MSASKTVFGHGFWRLAVASGLSNLADGVFKLALPLAAIAVTRSPTLVAGVELARSLPWLLLALPVGALADRLDRRRTMITANVARTTAVATLALAVQRDSGSIVVLFVVAFISGTAEVFYDTAGQSVLPSLVPRELLGRANGRLGAIELGGQFFIGPPLAGLLAGVGIAVAFGATTGLWLIAVVALVALRGRFRPERDTGPASIRSDVAEGLRFVVAHPTLRTLAAMAGVATLATSAAGTVLVLFAVGDDSALGLSQSQFGLLFLTSAAGSIAATAVNERIEHRLGRSHTLTLTMAGLVVFVGAPAVTDDVLIVAGSMFVGGALIMMWNIITVSFRQAITPDHLLGRVNSVYRLLAWGNIPLGAALGGLIAEAFGVRVVFASMGILAALLLIPARALTDTALEGAENDASPTP